MIFSLKNLIKMKCVQFFPRMIFNVLLEMMFKEFINNKKTYNYCTKKTI